MKGALIGGAGGAGIGALSAEEGQRLRGALVGGGAGAVLGGALGSLAQRGDMIPVADSIRAVETARSEAFDMGVNAAKQGLV